MCRTTLPGENTAQTRPRGRSSTTEGICDVIEDRRSLRVIPMDRTWSYTIETDSHYQHLLRGELRRFSHIIRDP